MQANNFQLQNLTAKVTFTTSGIDGKPSLHYQRGTLISQHYHGDQIRMQESEMGTLVTVTLRSTPDLSTVTLTLILPMVNLLEKARQTEVAVKAIETTSKTSIAGPRLVKGQVQTYIAYSLKGYASAVES